MKIAAESIVLVADGAKMLVLQNKGDNIYPDLRVLQHQEIDNPPNRERMSDAPGVTFSSDGPSHSTYDLPNPHQEAEDRFAAQAAAALSHVAQGNNSDILVIAPPDTLGVLRRHYDHATRARLVAEIDKDLTKHPVSEITRIIAAQHPND